MNVNLLQSVQIYSKCRTSRINLPRTRYSLPKIVFRNIFYRFLYKLIILNNLDK